MRGCNEASALASLLKCQTSDEVLFDGLFLTFYAGRFCAIVWNASDDCEVLLELFFEEK